MWERFLETADEFFAEAMEMGVREAEDVLDIDVPEDLGADLRAAVEERISRWRDYVNENLRADVDAGRYDAGDDDPPDRQGELDDELDARVGRYADALWPTAQQGFADTAMDAGVLMEWVLDDSVDNCEDCPAIAANSPYCSEDEPVEGVEVLATYPGDGDTACHSNCKCTLEFDQDSWDRYASENGLDRVDEDDEAA